MRFDRNCIPLWLKAFSLSLGIIVANFLIYTHVPVTVFPYDDLMFFDGIWRIAEGQRDGIDFYNPMGFGIFHVGGLLWRMLGPGRFVLPLTSAIFAAIIMLCGCVIGARRVARSVSLCLLVCTVLAFEASAPSAYGWSIFAFAMSGFYNRLSVAAIGVLFLQFFLPPPGGNRFIEAIIAAALLNIMLLTKISAVPLGLAVIGASLFLPRAERGTVAPAWRHLATILFLFLAMIVAEFLALGVQPNAVIAEYEIAAHTRGMLSWSEGFLRLAGNSGVAVTVLLMAVAGFAQIRTGKIKVSRLLVLTVTYLIVQVALNMANTQPATIFLAPVCAVILLASDSEFTWRRKLKSQAPIKSAANNLEQNLGPVLICALVLLPQMISSFLGAALATESAIGFLRPIIVTAGLGLALPVKSFIDDEAPVEDYAIAINSGLREINELGLSHETIASLDYANPFPSMLEAPSPKGVPVVWAIGYMEPRDKPLSPRELFGDSCVVMVPVRPVDVVEGSANFVETAAKPVLATSFTLIRDAPDWKIYRRNSCF